MNKFAYDHKNQMIMVLSVLPIILKSIFTSFSYVQDECIPSIEEIKETEETSIVKSDEKQTPKDDHYKSPISSIIPSFFSFKKIT